jgi:hypothetical protein
MGKNIGYRLVMLQLVCAASICAQTSIGFGAITGVVRDYANQGIPDTTVILSNRQMGIARSLETTDNGAFDASALTPGSGYHLKVTRKGFVNVEYGDFDIPLGHTLHFQISMQQEPATETQAPKSPVIVHDISYTSQISLSQLDLDTLPTPDGNVQPLAALSSVVTAVPSGELAFHSEPGTVAFLTDGILTTNTFYYDRPPVTPPVTQDALHELQIISGDPSAEVGHTMEGTFNAVTQGGGSALHGGVYGFLNSHGMNAPDRYATGFDASDSRHRYGANAGGPVRSNTIFWFVNIEDLQARSEEINRATNLLLTNSAGTAIVPSNCTATAAQCTSAISFLNAQLNRPVDSSLTSLTGFARADWRPNGSNDINFEVGAVHRHAPNGTETQTVANNAQLLGYNGTYTDETRFVRAGYTAGWGNVVNNVRVGWYRDRFSDYEDSSLLPSTGALAINIAGTPFGGNTQYPDALSEQHRQLVDNLSTTVGSHTFKVGVDYSMNQDWNEQVAGRFGSYAFPTLTAFADDFSGNGAGHKDYSIFNQTFGQPIVKLNSKTVNIYAQDTWRATNRLSVTVGILWEKPFLPKPTYTNTVFFQTASISSPDTNFSPRIGAAYRLGDKTTIHLGVGTYYQPFSGQLLKALYTGNAIYQLPITANPTIATETAAPIFPRVITVPSLIPLGTTDVMYGIGKLGNPEALQASLVIDREFSKNMSFSLGVTDSRGSKLWTAADQNLSSPTITKEYLIQNASGVTVNTYSTSMYTARTNTSYAQVYEVQNSGSSQYYGMTAQLRRRLSHGLTVQAAYTWSHSIDNVSGPPVVAGFIPASSVPGAAYIDRGNSSFNQPSRAVVSWTWEPTFSKSDSPIVRYTINGWQLSGIATFASALGETPLVVVNGQQFPGTTGVVMDYTSSLNGSGSWSRVPFQPVNSLLTSPEYVVDARLTRQIPITERVKAALMFEGYNAFNMQYNTSVNTISYLATSGILKPVAGLGDGNAADGSPWGDNARHLQIALRIQF